MKVYRLLYVTTLLALCFFWFGGTPVAAQTQPMRPVERRVNRPGDNEIDGKIVVARKLIGQRNFETAAAVLESVLETQPDNGVVQNLLMRCYEELKQYLKAETLARRFVTDRPNNLSYRLTLAELLALQNKNDEALQTYRQGIPLINPGDPNAHRLVLASMISHGFDREALVMIDSLRVGFGDASMFVLERGSILEKQGAYAQAADEYLELLAEDTTMDAVRAEKRLITMLEFVESSEPVESVLLDRADSTHTTRILGLLSSYYIKAGQFDRAFEFAVRQDSLDNARGRSVMYFLRQCWESRQYDQVVRVGRYVLDEFDDAPFTAEVSFRYAAALTELGRYDEAIATLSVIAETSPIDKDRGEALYQTGDIYLNRLNDYPMALTCFDSVLSHYHRGIGYLMSMRAEPVCYLRLGDLKQARQKLNLLTRRKLNDDWREEIDYYLGLITFFEHAYDSAEVALRKLIVDYPKGFYVNDALQLVLLISETKNAPALLGDYAQARFYQEQRQEDSTRYHLLRVVEAENKALADVGLYALATQRLLAADSMGALEYADRLIEEFPDSYYLPYGMKAKADILIENEIRAEEARTIYRHLLEIYPNYPFISEVRKRLRETETTVPIG